jgi:enolase-phosphatase E1
VDEPFDMAAAGIEVVLLDIEGTTTPISFVHQRLFPYARARAAEFLQQHASDLEIQRVVSDLRSLQTAADSDAPAGDIVSFVQFLIDNDRKLGPLKALQGRMWEQGYAIGELEGEVYADVLPAFERWTRAEIRVAIFSSGSVLAQRLLFSNSTAGDLSPYISKFFDTSVGAKGDTASYRRILETLDLRAPAHALFVSDVVRELDAARDAGLRTLLCVRPASPAPEANGHSIIESFDVLLP